MTDARAVTLAVETLSVGTPAARTAYVAVEVLLSPVALMAPPTGHLLYTGHTPVVESVLPPGVYPFTGALGFTGRVPVVTNVLPDPYVRDQCFDAQPFTTPAPSPPKWWNPAPEPLPE